MEKELEQRSGSACELCSAKNELSSFLVAPKSGDHADEYIFICTTCKEQIEDPSKINANHWRCLNESIWSEITAVKVIAWRILNKLKSEGWPQDLLDMMYLEDETLEWAKSGESNAKEIAAVIHKDSNGVILEAGDSVVLIKDLNVKGTSLVAKRGAAVRNIRLVHDNPEFIEGKVNGQQIVIITKYVKKTN